MGSHRPRGSTIRRTKARRYCQFTRMKRARTQVLPRIAGARNGFLRRDPVSNDIPRERQLMTEASGGRIRCALVKAVDLCRVGRRRRVHLAGEPSVGQIVHRAAHGAARGLGASNIAAGRCKEPRIKSGISRCRRCRTGSILHLPLWRRQFVLAPLSKSEIGHSS